ncbi:MAG: exo-alpha-sialidase [Xanthomonadales bacterium]|nr:exo-alpha-sialidase [Xanthomonadales bacterium]
MIEVAGRSAPRAAMQAAGLLALAAALGACQRDAGERPAPARAAAPASASAVAVAGRRITGGPQPAVPAEPLAYVASGASALAASCAAGAGSGVAFVGAEVEPRLAIHPTRPGVMVAAWQQDRWSDGGARALVAATSLDGGRNWTRTPLPFSRCGGGSVLNGGDYERASDPWVSYGPDGVLHAMSLSFSGGTFQTGSANAMLASRSFDDGRTWTAPVTLIRDAETAFNDKNAITADPHDARYVYAVWDRLTAIGNRGPTYFTRSTDGGAHWEAARPIFDPGQRSQTIGNLVVVLSDGTLLDVFDRIDSPLGGLQTARAQVIRSTDRGAT